MGLTPPAPPRLNNVQKTALFSRDGFPYYGLLSMSKTKFLMLQGLHLLHANLNVSVALSVTPWQFSSAVEAGHMLLTRTRLSNIWVCSGGKSESFLRNQHFSYRKGRLDLNKQVAGSAVLQQNPKRGK